MALYCNILSPDTAMRLIGYGEDALTYFALTQRLPEFLHALGDISPARETTVFFRPSFGRRAHAKPDGRSSPFGEFDGIVGTARAVYLVEAKWSRSGEVWKPELALRAKQVRRHAVFRWYLGRWRAERPASWEAFATPAVTAAFEDRFAGMTLPVANTVLAQSLGYVLGILTDQGPIIEDVLLYCDIDGKVCPPGAAADTFRRVEMQVPGAHVSGFFALNAEAGVSVATV